MTKVGVPQTIKEFNLWENYPVIFYLSPNLNKTKKNLILSSKMNGNYLKKDNLHYLHSIVV